MLNNSSDWLLLGKKMICRSDEWVWKDKMVVAERHVSNTTCIKKQLHKQGKIAYSG
jgi:hypothetical protein